MMNSTRRGFIGSAAAFSSTSVLAAGGLSKAGAKVAASQKAATTEEVDVSPWEKPDGSATDSVLARRMYLDLSGRLPTRDEAMDYAQSSNPAKRQALVDQLLSADSFADYWSMRFCDILRVKSEFPVNLWPNAVYVYHRRIRDFVAKNEPWDHFARALLTATGSDFRDAEANFVRATARRNPEGYAEAAALTFLGWQWKEIPEQTRGELTGYFSAVRVKNTREWKEEVVLCEGHDRRGEFVQRLLGEWRDEFARAFVKRVHWWMLGRLEAPDKFVRAFREGGYRLRPLVRAIALSHEYSRGCEKGGFPFRRLDAEVLDDAICDLTGIQRAYQSIAPEPFTFLPKDRRSILIEDGSISNAFLLLFGRPARDTGLLSERHNEVTAKQRLYLYNSGKLFGSLARIVDGRAYRRQSMRAIIDDLYWRFYSRAPQPSERRRLLEHFAAIPRKNGNERWRFPRDLAWCLVNSREFLYQH